MSEKIPKSAIGMKVGSEARTVTQVQAFLQEFGYLSGSQTLFESDAIFMRDSDDHLLDNVLDLSN